MTSPAVRPVLVSLLFGVLAVAACSDDAAEGGGSSGAPDGGGGASSSSSGAASSSGGASSSSGGSSSSSGGSSSSSSSGGPDAGPSEPIVAPPGEWTWIDFPGAHCRDGSSTGAAVRFTAASNKVMVYLQGGGACFNAQTCAGNQSHYDGSSFSGPSNGIFDATDEDNPVRDYNVVWLPYCTGDVHTGNEPAGAVAGVSGVQEFVGYHNLDVVLDRVVPTFPAATQVLLTGESAGGFGAVANFEHVQRRFGSVPVAVVDDSGPPLGSAVVTPCLQQLWRETWGFDATLLADCGADCTDPSDYLGDYVGAIRARHTNLKAGLVSSSTDGTIRYFFGFGLAACAGGTIGEAAFEDGLLDFRASVQTPGPGFSTFYVESSQHTWLTPSFGQTVDGTSLKEFVGGVLSGTTQHVGLD